MIVPGRADHTGAVAVLEQEAMGSEAWSRTQVAEELTGERRVVRLAQDADGVHGWVDLAPAGDVADLLRVAVHPTARRRGLAGRLVEAGLAALPGGVTRVVLEVGAGNDAARGLYDGLGFVEVARRRAYYRDGSDAVVMTREHGTDVRGDA